MNKITMLYQLLATMPNSREKLLDLLLKLQPMSIDRFNSAFLFFIIFCVKIILIYSVHHQKNR